jgi:NAD(P)-dependent dehydrogenase (short-subunit alcohol dehydrogenase family)
VVVSGEFTGKVAIVTGAASGICRVTLQAFVRAGARGVIADLNEEWGAKAAEGLRAEGGEVLFIRTDVRDSGSVDHLVAQTVSAYGGLDILVNCAGVGVHKTIVEMTDDEWDFQVDTQLRAVFLTCRAAGRQMIRQGRGGRIINFGSTGGLVARVRSAAHGASKAGVVHFTKVLALELGPHGITANVVAPGLTDIRAISKAYPTDEYTQRFVQEVPLGRLADPQEIADTVLFVASDRARFLSAQAIYVDGGYSAGKLSIDGPHRTAYAPTAGPRRP